LLDEMKLSLYCTGTFLKLNSFHLHNVRNSVKLFLIFSSYLPKSPLNKSYKWKWKWKYFCRAENGFQKLSPHKFNLDVSIGNFYRMLCIFPPFCIFSLHGKLSFLLILKLKGIVSRDWAGLQMLK
jgi:hypothetical protein